MSSLVVSALPGYTRWPEEATPDGLPVELVCILCEHVMVGPPRMNVEGCLVVPTGGSPLNMYI